MREHGHGGSIILMSSVEAYAAVLSESRTSTTLCAATPVSSSALAGLAFTPAARVLFARYGSAKEGLRRMVKGLSADLAGTGIRANCIAPVSPARSPLPLHDVCCGRSLRVAAAEG